MDKTRPNALYRAIAKDYNPKQAEMNICRYVQMLEQRIEALEALVNREKEPEEPNTGRSTARKKGSNENG